jgi:hypothetical protein
MKLHRNLHNNTLKVNVVRTSSLTRQQSSVFRVQLDIWTGSIHIGIGCTKLIAWWLGLDKTQLSTKVAQKPNSLQVPGKKRASTTWFAPYGGSKFLTFKNGGN